jgi:hypothetical protein
MSFVRRNPLLSFFVLAYGLSWSYWIPLALAGVPIAPGSNTTVLLLIQEARRRSRPSALLVESSA